MSLATFQEHVVHAAEATKDFIVTSPIKLKDLVIDLVKDAKDDVIHLYEDVKYEFTSQPPWRESLATGIAVAKKFIHIPYLPAFHSPGWLLRYVVGPYDQFWIDGLVNDAGAGLTVGLTLIPQSLSYAKLANMPPINGLYSAVLPSAVYTFFGSSMQLSVGPVALVSLLVGQLVNQYGAASGTQAALSVGIILVVLSVLNLGQLIFYVAHPVMSGFTTGAAMIIGLQQLKSAFGFSNSPPQTGQTGFDYNYQVFQWFADHWYDETSYRVTKTSPYHNYPVRDFLSVHMAFGLFVPLLIIKVLQNRISKISSDETKGTFIYKFYHFVSNISPFIGLIIATNITWQIYTNANDSNSTLNNYYIKNLTIVGSVQAGFNFLGNPALPYPFWQFLGDCIPITFVAYMEGYGVAQRIARQKNELHLLNASQEMWAVGVSNLLGSVSGAFPVTGSFSRSSLNAVAGARTPFSKTTTLFVILTALGTLTPTFFFIPNAALAAIIWVAIWPLINFVDIWNAWRYSKKDFFLIILTFGLEFVFNTEIGLAVGLSTSLLIFVLDTTFNPSTQIHVVSSGKENNGVDIVKFEGSEFTFLNSTRVKNFIIELSYLAPKKPDPNNLNRVIFYNVSQTLDKVLRPDLLVPVDTLPKAIVVDFHSIRIVDITALIGLAEVVHETASRGVSLVLINIHPSVIDYFTKYKIKNQVFDPSISDVDLSQYLKHSDLEVEHIGHDEYALRFPQIYKDNHDAEAGGTNKGSGRGI